MQTGAPCSCQGPWLDCSPSVWTPTSRSAVGVAEGAFLEANLVPTVGQMPLAPGRYQWRATIGNQTWSRTFTVRGARRPRFRDEAYGSSRPAR